MKRIAEAEFFRMSGYKSWELFDALQTELETRGEGMSVEEIRAYFLDNHSFAMSLRLAQEIQPLTIQQGFTPDWDKAPEWAIGAQLVYCQTGEWSDKSLTDDKWTHEGKLYPTDWIDRPVTKREKTREEKGDALYRKGINLTPIFDGMEESLINDLCIAAGISLTTEEK